jgi:hypothetical protein
MIASGSSFVLIKDGQLVTEKQAVWPRPAKTLVHFR